MSTEPGAAQTLNPGKKFDKVGETIAVANVINTPAATIGRKRSTRRF
jgi:hypothetical protein